MSRDKLNIEIDWLKKLSEGLKTIKDDEFKYHSVISKCDADNTCGTVCCAYGWMPKFVPESGVEWIKINSVVGDAYVSINKVPDQIFNTIFNTQFMVHEKLYFVGNALLDFIFYGTKDITGYSDYGLSSTLEIEMIEYAEHNGASVAEFFGSNKWNINLNKARNRIKFAIHLMQNPNRITVIG